MQTNCLINVELARFSENAPRYLHTPKYAGTFKRLFFALFSSPFRHDQDFPIFVVEAKVSVHVVRRSSLLRLPNDLLVILLFIKSFQLSIAFEFIHHLFPAFFA